MTIMMKRPLTVLLIVIVSSALGGVGLAWLQFEAQLHAVAGAAASAARARETEAKNRAMRLAATVCAADEVAFIFDDHQREKEMRLRDRNWLNHFSTAIEETTCQSAATKLWSSTLRIRFFQNGNPVLELMLLDNVLRVLDAQQTHDFVIGHERAAALSALVPEATYIR
jgi:hypothetical protein